MAVLKPGDLIRLRIWREPDLSGDFAISESGTATFPKIGTLSVVMVPIDSLRAVLLREYDVYLRNPSIEVTVLRRISVQGAVRNPGLYSVDLTMTIADALALAGGASPTGQPDKVRLIRGGETQLLRLTQTTLISQVGVQSGDRLFVPERSWLSRNPGIIAALITGSALVARQLIK